MILYSYSTLSNMFQKYVECNIDLLRKSHMARWSWQKKWRFRLWEIDKRKEKKRKDVDDAN